MPLPTREERETVLILNDAGGITIWTISPTQTRRLTRRLGQPARKEGDCSFWSFTTATHTFKLPSRRRRTATKEGVS